MFHHDRECWIGVEFIKINYYSFSFSSFCGVNSVTVK